MLRRLFQFSSENVDSRNGANSNRPAGHSVMVIEQMDEAGHPVSPASSPGLSPEENLAKAKTISFEQVYQNAAVKPPRLPYGILKVSAMVNSSHLSGMSPEAKRCALLMALEATGAEIEDLLQDAVVRQRALSDHEEALQDKLQKFETAKAEENRQIQAELDRLTKQYMSRIQGNLDQVAREQDEFRDWQQRKQSESERITEAATFCVPQGSATGNAGLTAVLERANYHRR
jgi:Skp family chaperone for outer membrane proteins